MRTEYDLYHWDADYTTPTVKRLSDISDARVAAGHSDINDWKVAEDGNYVLVDALTAAAERIQSPWLIEEVKVPETDPERIDLAIDLVIEYGGIDGDHHKTWVIDQMVRLLAGDRYEQIVAEACTGEDGPDTYTWDEGVAP